MYIYTHTLYIKGVMRFHGTRLKCDLISHRGEKLSHDIAMTECEGGVGIEYATATFTSRFHCGLAFYRNKTI